MFTDYVKLKLQAGKGGKGVVAWRREKFIPKGGPAGGDGGIGGNIILKASAQILSLEEYRNKRILKAQNGAQGGAGNKKGKNGQHLVIQVPVGTLVKDQDNNIIFDLTKDKEELIICKGGKGGKGNIHFKSPTNQAPNICTPGKYGEEKELSLELKLIADVGLIGMPNAGKSTLLNNISKANVKIAPYPFTTLKPNLGIVEFEDFSKILIADIPGIIKDAHKNKGLGISFLKHIERTKCLIFVIDISATDCRDPLEDFINLENEIKSFNPQILEKPFFIVLNKIDKEEAQEYIEKFKNHFASRSIPIFEISALNNIGIAKIVKTMQQHVLSTNL